MRGRLNRIMGMTLAVTMCLSGCGIIPGLEKSAEDCTLQLVCAEDEKEAYTKLAEAYQESGLAKVNILTESEMGSTKEKIDLISSKVQTDKKPITGGTVEKLLSQMENLAFSLDTVIETGEIPVTAEVPVLYYNKKIFEEAELSVPQNSEGISDIAAYLKYRGTEYPIGFVADDDAYDIDEMLNGMLSQVGNWNEEKFVESNDGKTIIQNIENMAGHFAINGYIIPMKEAAKNKEQMFEMLEEGKCAMFFGTSGDYLEQSSTKSNLGMEGIIYSNLNVSLPMIDGNRLCLLSDKQINGVTDFLKFLYSSQGQQLLSDSTGNIPVTIDCNYNGLLESVYGRVQAGIIPDAKSSLTKEQWENISQQINQELQNKEIQVEMREEKNDE